MADILYNITGQTLDFDAPEGRPSSVTSVSVWPMSGSDDDTAETAIGSPAVETNPNTTFDVVSGAGQTDPTKCNLTAVTGISVGRKYLATNADGQTEWLEVVDVNSTGYALARYPLHNSYAVGDSFASTRISATVDSTWVADSNNISDNLDPNPGYRVRWVYVVSGVTYVHDTYFDLVRYKGQHTVKPSDVEVLIPGWLDALPIEHRSDRGRAIIDRAYEDVRLDLMESGIPDELLRNADVRDDLTIRKTIVLSEEAKVILGSGSLDGLDVATKRYQGRLDKLIRITNRTAMAVGNSGGGARPTVVGIWEK